MKNNSPLIALDVSQMIYTGHGVGRYTQELARALLQLNTNLQFTFYAGALRQLGQFKMRRGKRPWSRARWRLFPIPPRLSTLIFNSTSLPIELLIGAHDLVHTSDWTQPVSSCPSVTTIHDLAFHFYPETVHPLVLGTQRRRLARVIKSGAHLIADSNSTKLDLMKIYQLDSSQISVVYPGISSAFEVQKKTRIDQVKIKYKLPDQYLLTLGTREPRKNLARLIQAVDLLREKDKKIPPLVIAGRYGWGETEPASPSVTVTGFIDEADLPTLYSGANAFVYPSLYEGFGFPVLEAMACATPTVTSNLSSLPEVAGSAAILVDPHNPSAIARGISEALAARKSLRRLGLAQAKRFSWERTAKETIKVYERVLSENRP